MTLGPNTVPMPTNDPFVNPRRWEKYPNPKEKDPSEGLLTFVATSWLQSLNNTAQATVTTYPVVLFEDQNTSIAATPFQPVSLSYGLYRVTYSMRTSVIDTTSLRVEASISWIRQGVTQSQTSALMTGNTTTTFQSGSHTILIDSATSINYSTNLVALGTGDGKYEIAFFLEALGQ